MKFHLTATAQELAEKGESLVKSVSDLLAPVSPDLAAALEKALPRKEAELKFPVLRELQKKTEVAYDKQMELMVKDIGKVLDKSLKKSEASEPIRTPVKKESTDYAQKIVAKEEKTYEQIKKELKGKGYVESDFEVGGPLHGYSTNELIDLVRDKRGD